MDHLHSLLRFPIYMIGLAAFGYALWGLLRKRPYEKLMWDLAGAFAISLYVQIVVGFLMIFTSRYFSGPLGIHMVLSMVAAALAQLTYSANRRRAREDRDFRLHVWGIGVALVLLVAGIAVMHESASG
jgi:heme A synthase